MKLYLKIFSLFFIIATAMFFLFIILPFIVISGAILSIPALLSGRRQRTIIINTENSDERVLDHGNEVIDVKAEELK